MALVRMMQVACISLALAGAARAQVLLYELVGTSNNDGFGSSVTAVADVDGDGHLDLVIGAPLDDLHGLQSGRVAVHSGVTGDVLLELHGSAQNRFGTSVARAFDMDRDGLDDILIGVPGANNGFGRADLYALPSGDLLHSQGFIFQELFGDEVVGFGDITGDGVPDYGVATAFTDGGLAQMDYEGCLYGYGGAGGGIPGYPQPCAPIFCDAAGDVNGDGVNDYLLGEWEYAINDKRFVALRSGVSHASLDSLIESDVVDEVGAFAGRDVDGDGQPEYLFTYTDSSQSQVAQVRRIPQGGSKAILFTITLTAVDYPGLGPIAHACFCDVSGDGRPDVLLGFPDASTPVLGWGSVLAFDGEAPHAFLFRIDGESTSSSSTFPEALVALDDLDGDGIDEFAVGVDATSSKPGAVRVYSRPRWEAAWLEYGPPLVGLTVPHLAGSGLPAPLSPISIVADSAQPSSMASMVLGLGSLMQLFKGGFLLATPDFSLGPYFTDAAGELDLSGTIPATAPPGLSLHFQLWIQDPNTPAGWAATNGLRMTVMN